MGNAISKLLWVFLPASFASKTHSCKYSTAGNSNPWSIFTTFTPPGSIFKTGKTGSFTHPCQKTNKPDIPPPFSYSVHLCETLVTLPIRVVSDQVLIFAFKMQFKNSDTFIQKI